MAPLIGRIVIVLDPPYEWLPILLLPVFWGRRWNWLLQSVMFSPLGLQQPRRVVCTMLTDCGPSLSPSIVLMVLAAVFSAGVASGALGTIL
jgi:hypothetical protein